MCVKKKYTYVIALPTYITLNLRLGARAPSGKEKAAPSILEG
jgi:hypothetical protein